MLQIRDALRHLPLDLQVVVELHYWEEHSTAQIATVLEVPQGTVKSRLRRARALLENLLDAQDTELADFLGRARPQIDDVDAPSGVPPS